MEDSNQPRNPAWRGLLFVVLAAAVVTGFVVYSKWPRGREPLRALAVTDLDGKAWKADEHRGKVVMVNIWATWCPPCRAETPDLVAVANEFAPRGLEAVGLSVDGPQTQGAVRPFVEQNKVPYPVAVVTSAELPVATDVIPVTLLVDKQGRVAKRFDGAVAKEELRAEVERLLGEGG